MDRTVVGILTGLEPRNAGWFRFSIQEPNMQWPVKADTKKIEIVQACQGLMGTQVSCQISEQQSDQINPHNGQPFTNRYLNAVAPASPGMVSTQAQPQAQGYVPPYVPPVQQGFANTNHPSAPVQQQAPPMAPPVQVNEQTRELRIMRQSAAERSIRTLIAQGAEITQQSLVECSEFWLAYFVYGPARFGVRAFDQAPAQPAQQAPAAPAAQAQDPGPDPSAMPIFDENGNPVLDESGLPVGY